MTKLLHILSVGIIYNAFHQNQCEAFAFSSTSLGNSMTSTLTSLSKPKCITHLHATNSDDMSNSISSRRDAFQKIAITSFAAFGFGLPSLQQDGNDTAYAAEEKGATIWKSGKEPIVPGKKPRDKNDTKGTRKDGEFLRSISNCKSQCETSYGSDGLARSKEECLSDCQDICCQTYEQCTFGIVPRI